MILQGHEEINSIPQMIYTISDVKYKHFFRKAL